jgi:nitrate reductase NapAB chaperone NapD
VAIGNSSEIAMKISKCVQILDRYEVKVPRRGGRLLIVVQSSRIEIHFDRKI